MKIIFKIARAELRTLFYSPIAWIILVVFFVISGMQFVTPLMDGARVQELQLANSPGWSGFRGPLTLNIFIETLRQMVQYLYLFIPLLTMGTINREVNAGTMKLLSSSPVRIREIVMGKYIGLVGFNLVLLSSVALMLFTGYFVIQHAEFNWYLSILLSLFFLSNTYMAIGLFISCLTSYQIVAGIATFIAFFIITAIGGVWQQYDFFRDITWFLSISARTESMISGLITSRDVIYFILLILLFLGLSVIKLKSSQESKRFTVSLYRNLTLIVVILLTGYFTSRPGMTAYLDVTRDKINTIDTATQAVIKELDGSPITVTLYTNLMGDGVLNTLPVSRNQYVWGFWDKYVRFYPNIKLKYEYYYDVRKNDSSMFKSFPNKNIHQIAAQVGKLLKVDTANFKKPGEIDKLVDLSREDQLRVVMQLEYKGKKTFLRTNNGEFWPHQPNVSASIRRLTRDSFPQLAFTTGHYERSPWRNGEREFGTHTNTQISATSLINVGIDADTLSLLRNEIPATTSVLVVADPKSKLEATEQEKIDRYIENGGNALFYAEPGKQQMLNPMLNKMGINLEPGILVKPALHRSADVFIASLNKTGNYMAREAPMQRYQTTRKDSASAYFKGVCYIKYKDTAGFRVEPILPMPGQKGLWVENGGYVADSAAPLYSPAEGDLQKTEYIIGVRLTRMVNNKEQRIIVLGDADFMSQQMNNGLGIGQGLYSWMVYNEYPVYTNFILPKDIYLSIGKDPAKLLWYVYVYILPGLLLLTGSIILIRRKRK